MAHHVTTAADACTDCSSEWYNIGINLVGFFSNSERQIYETVNYVAISGVIALLGIVTNIINIIVFYKQGFSSTVNISLFALAVSDLFNLIFVMWMSLGLNPHFVFSNIDIWPAEIVHLTAGMPHNCFTRITGWITVFITAERCLCIALPLKIKQIVTPRRTTLIIIAICIVVIATFVPEYATSYHDWKFIEIKNRTLLGLFYTSEHDKVNGLSLLLHSILGSASFVAVVIFTLVLVVQLNRKSKWRTQVITAQDQFKTISNREKKTITMVVMISILLIVCYTPGVICSMVAFFKAEFGMFGVYVNAYYITWSFVFVMETLNASINIFFYYFMSMNYRATFRWLFSGCLKDSADA